MPIQLEIIRAHEFIRLGTQSELDFDATYGALTTLARACNLRQIRRALLDVRGVQSELTPEALAGLVRSFEEIGFSRDQRLALLHQGDPDRKARVFALISQYRGWKVQAFDSFEEAMVWLSEEDPSADPKPADEGNFNVPINQGPT
ncbi:hypothetical protein GC207_05505 [bacterium]|nr:hypothetical protein [bacterium]